MKWKTKNKLSPKVGDIRYVKHFALFPERCSDGLTVWLQWYWKQQEYQLISIEGYGWAMPTFYEHCKWKTTHSYSERPEES